MGLLDMFRPRPPIRDVPALADFIDENAAFLVQKGIYEYSRARAGHYAKVLFSEAGFQEAVENARWRAYPLGLAMVAELVEGVLRSHGGAERRARSRRAHRARARRSSTATPCRPRSSERRLARCAATSSSVASASSASMRSKPAKDIPEPFAEAYFALMPIDRKLRASEFPTIRNYLQGDALQYPRGVFEARRRAGPRRDAVVAAELRAHGR